MKDLLEGQTNFAFIDSGPHIREMREIFVRPYASEELVLCCSEEFRRTHLGKDRSYSALKSLSHIPYHRDKEGIYKWYAHHFRRVPDFSWSLAVDHPHGVLAAILKTRGLGVIPRNLITSAIEKQIAIIPGPQNALKSEILFAQNKARVPSKSEKAVIALMFQN